MVLGWSDGGFDVLLLTLLADNIACHNVFSSAGIGYLLWHWVSFEGIFSRMLLPATVGGHTILRSIAYSVDGYLVCFLVTVLQRSTLHCDHRRHLVSLATSIEHLLLLVTCPWQIVFLTDSSVSARSIGSFCRYQRLIVNHFVWHTSVLSVLR